MFQQNTVRTSHETIQKNLYINDVTDDQAWAIEQAVALVALADEQLAGPRDDHEGQVENTGLQLLFRLTNVPWKGKSYR